MLAEALRRAVTPLLLIACVAAVALAAHGAGIVLQRRVTLGLIDLVAVIGLYVFMGNSGVTHFGGAGFMAIGAYGSALTTMPPMMKRTFLPDLPGWLAAAHLPAPAGAFVAAAASGTVALVIGAPILRLSGIGAAIATLSLLIIAYVGLGNWTAFTGGQQSLMGLPAYVGLTTAALWAAGAILVAYVYQETRFAIALRASREDETAARACGVRVVVQRLGAFTLSATLFGAAGALYGHFLGTLRIETFYFDLTFLMLSMLVIGGQRSLTGAVVGSGIVVGLTEALRQIEIGFVAPGTSWRIAAAPGFGDVVLAALLLGILLWRPRGLTGGREIDRLLLPRA